MDRNSTLMIKAQITITDTNSPKYKPYNAALDLIFNNTSGQLLGITFQTTNDDSCGLLDLDDDTDTTILLEDVITMKSKTKLKTLNMITKTGTILLKFSYLMDFFILSSFISVSIGKELNFNILTMLTTVLNAKNINLAKINLFIKALSFFPTYIDKPDSSKDETDILTKRCEIYENDTIESRSSSKHKAIERLTNQVYTNNKELDRKTVYNNILLLVFSTINDIVLSNILMNFKTIETLFSLDRNEQYQEMKKANAKMNQLMKNQELSSLIEQYTNLCTLEKSIVSLSAEELPLQKLRSFEVLKHEKLEKIAVRVAHNSRMFNLLNNSLSSSSGDQTLSNFILGMNDRDHNTSSRLKLLNKLLRFGSLKGERFDTFISDRLDSDNDESKVLAIEVLLVTLDRDVIFKYCNKLMSKRTFGLFLQRAVALGFFEQLEWLVQDIYAKSVDIKGKAVLVSSFVLTLISHSDDELDHNVVKILNDLAVKAKRNKRVIVNILKSFIRIFEHPKLLSKIKSGDNADTNCILESVKNLLSRAVLQNDRRVGLIQQYGLLLDDKLSVLKAD